MIEACKAIDGGMSAVMFCPLPTLQSVLADIQKEGGFCEISNINSPKQVTVSGTRDVLSELPNRIRKTKEGRRARVLPLNVSYPFHCSVMTSAAEEYQQFIHDSLQHHIIEIRDPSIPLISNVDSFVVGYLRYTSIVDDKGN